MSTDIWQVPLDSSDLDLGMVDRVRRIMSVFNDERTYGDVITITHTLKNQQKRELQAVVFDRVALATTIERHPDYFGKYGITESSHPLHVAVTIEHLPTLDRERGYGYLFGYPDHAVDFFCNARRKWTQTGEFVKRDFVTINTFGPNGIVWAVPKGKKTHPENQRFVARADQINDVYRELRKKCGDNHVKLLSSVREWKASNPKLDEK